MLPAIRVENLTKSYRLVAAAAGRYRTLRESLTSAVGAWFRARSARDRGWLEVLRGVSFDIAAGEVVGLLGRNGAGKSTLLKILARITEPSSGAAIIRGRVGSLLEVGTGFHPELTGRENVFLNGAVLGMARREVARRFDAIVAFAEVERFLDTPVKRYSTGMFMRLAFAVAAHLDPDVLLVDEVLAVGDAAFQRKCLEKMRAAAAAGRTVLVVSHDLTAVARLCRRALLLDAGRVVRDGPAAAVIDDYLHSGLGLTPARVWDAETAPGDDVVRLRAVRIRDADGRVSGAIDIRRPSAIEIEYDVLRSGHGLVPNYHFFTARGECAFVAHDLDPAWRRRPKPAGRYQSAARVPGNFLADGTMTVGVAVTTYLPFTVHCQARDAIAFRVLDSAAGDSARGDFAGPIPGAVRPILDCETQLLAGEVARCA
jgi:lipopolysaccharide transport system ATP-binding protein